MIEDATHDRATRFPRWVAWGLVGIVVVSIPGYWPRDVVRPFVMGMPLWAFVSLLACVAFAALTSFAILRYWKD